MIFHLLFLWQKDFYFPSMSNQGGWMQGLWAWSAGINLKIINKMPHFEFSFDGSRSIDVNKSDKKLIVQPPPCYLHFGWEDLDKIDAHVKYYRESGLIPNMANPMHIGGRPERIEEWMNE